MSTELSEIEIWRTFYGNLPCSTVSSFGLVNLVVEETYIYIPSPTGTREQETCWGGITIVYVYRNRLLNHVTLDRFKTSVGR
jgi:hypothetical protein